MIELGKIYKDCEGNDVRIICVDRKHQTHPIIGLVSFGTCENQVSFTKEGTYHYGCNCRYDLILPEDYSSYKIDEPVMVRDSDSQVWVKGYFAGTYYGDGRPCTFDCQRTSWTETTKVIWNQCRRPTPEELGEKE